MPRRVTVALLLKLLPAEWKRRLGIHLGAPDLRWSIGQLVRFGFIPRTIMDVGAFRGEWTRICLQLFPEAHFTCIEPQDGVQRILKELERRYSNVKVVQALLGSHNREDVPFDEMGPGSSVFGSDRRKTGKPMTTIDHLLESGVCRPPQLLKLDVQGYEIEALEGYTIDFDKCEVIQCELSLLPLVPQAPLLDEVTTYLRKRGFVMFDVEEIIQAPSDGAVWQIDALFCRKDSPLRTKRVWLKKA